MKQVFAVVLLGIGIVSIFFYKSVFFGQIPFPGDLLMNTSPFKYESILGFDPGGYPHKAQGGDVISHILPWKLYSVSQLTQGQIPWWNPYNFSGNILMQNYQSAVFSPFNVLFFLTSFADAWTLFIMIQPLFAFLGMYLLLRSETLSFPARMVGAISFSFSSYMAVWMQYGNIAQAFMWTPYLLWGIRMLVVTGKWRYAYVSAVSLLASFFGGYIQATFYMLIIALIYTFTLRSLINRTQLSRIGVLITLLCCAGLIAMIQIFPTLVAFGQSSRLPYTLSEIQRLLQPVANLITIVAPDFFGNPVTRNYVLDTTYIENVLYPGIVVLIAALAAVRFGWSRKEIKVWGITAVVVLIITTQFPFVAYLYQLPIPVLSTTVPTRGLSVFLFALSMLAAYGIHDWIEKRASLVGPAVFVLCLIGAGYAAAFYLQIVPAPRNLIIPTLLTLSAIGISLIVKRERFLGGLMLSLVVCVDLFLFFQKITPFSPKETFFPDTQVMSFLKDKASHEGPYRHWGYGSAYMYGNLATAKGTYSPEGIDPLHSALYTAVLASTQNGSIPEKLPRPDANLAGGYGADGMRNNPYRKQMMDFLGVKYVIHESGGGMVSDVQTFPDDQFSLAWHDDRLQVYENRTVMPRAFVTKHVMYVDGGIRQTIDAWYARKEKDMVIVDEEIALDYKNIATGSATIVSYSPHQIHIKTKTTAPMLMVLSDTWYPEWKATVNGEPVRILRANGAFRAVMTESGESDIYFEYVPESFYRALPFAAVGLLGAVCFAIWGCWRRKI
jgi:hypothetical protein